MKVGDAVTSPRRHLNPTNPSAGMLEEHMPGIVHGIHREEGRYSIQYSEDGMIDSNMPGVLLKPYNPPIYTTYDPVEMRVEIGSDLEKFDWEKGIIVNAESNCHEYTVLLLNGTLRKGVNWCMLRTYNPRVYGEGDPIVHRKTAIEGMVLQPCLGKPHRYDVVMKGGKIEKCINWNMIKPFEPPVYQVGDLVTYKYRPAIIQKAYLRDDTYSIRYEGDKNYSNDVNNDIHNDLDKDSYRGRVKWIYLERRVDPTQGKNTKQESDNLGHIKVGDAVECGFRGSRKAGIIKRAYVDGDNDDNREVLYDVEGEDGTMITGISARHIRKFQPMIYELNDIVRISRDNRSIKGEIDYEEGIIVKVHDKKDKYDVKIIEAEFVANWTQGEEYKQTQWGRKPSPFDKKVSYSTDVDSSGVDFNNSLFDDSFMSTSQQPQSLLSTPRISPGPAFSKLLPSGSLFSESPSSSSTALAPSPPPSSLSLGDMHSFSLASTYIPCSVQQDRVLKVTSIIRGKLNDGNFISGYGIIEGTTISLSDSEFNDGVVRVTGGCGYYKMSTNQRHAGVERKLQAYSYRREVSWHKMKKYRPIRTYKLNDAVEVLTTCGRYSRDPLLFSADLEKRVWLAGAVTKVRRGNVYDIAFTNSREDEGVLAVNMRPIEAPVYGMNETVHIRCGKKQIYLGPTESMSSSSNEGKILKSNYDNTYDVLYTETGQVEKNVSWYRISKAVIDSIKSSSKSLKVFSESEDCQVLVPVATLSNGHKMVKEGASEWIDGVVVKRTALADKNTFDLAKDTDNNCSYTYEVKLLPTGEIVKVPDKHGAAAIRESLLVFSFSDLLKIN